MTLTLEPADRYVTLAMMLYTLDVMLTQYEIDVVDPLKKRIEALEGPRVVTVGG